VASAYPGRELRFGPDYLIPTPFDSRLILRIAPAVAEAAAASGVATRPITDIKAYRDSLSQFVTNTGLFMRPLFLDAKAAPKRIAYAEGEDERVLRAAQIAIDEGIAKPILIGRPDVIATRIERAGLRLQDGVNCEIVNPAKDERFKQYYETYHQLRARDGITPELAKVVVRRSNSLIATLMLKLGDADGMICGVIGRYDLHLAQVQEVIGARPEAHGLAALNALILDQHNLFIADTFVNEDPTAEQLADIAALAVEEVQRFGLPPRVAFLSHSMFGSSSRPSARKMRQARDIFVQRMPHIPADGEMQGDAALSESVRHKLLPNSTLQGTANILICPNLDAANILFNVLKMTGGQGVTVGPILLGAAAPAHILTPSATVRRIVNMTAVAVAHDARQNKPQ
jgi:malate dehydrogenase (oxaloacetate-decarboxylating)(NADP+)